MRILFTLLVLILITSCTQVPETSLQSSSLVSEQETVAAKWLNGRWYSANLKAAVLGEYVVEYADGWQDTISQDSVRLLRPTTSLEKGDQVQAIWQGSAFYRGWVELVTEGGALIRWEDGSPNSYVSKHKLFKVN